MDDAWICRLTGSSVFLGPFLPIRVNPSDPFNPRSIQQVEVRFCLGYNVELLKVSALNIAAEGSGRETRMDQSPEEITALLQEWRDGNRAALDQLIPIVCEELRRIAHRYVRRQAAGMTLQTTAVVHEAYMRLAGQGDVAWQNRAHFYGVCAQVMRSLLVDRARARNAVKRGGGQQKLSLVDEAASSQGEQIDIVALDQALDRLAAIDPRKARIVELRYFGGLTVEETGSFLDLSPITIKREWLKAKAWLYNELHHPDGEQANDT